MGGSPFFPRAACWVCVYVTFDQKEGGIKEGRIPTTQIPVWPREFFEYTGSMVHIFLLPFFIEFPKKVGAAKNTQSYLWAEQPFSLSK